MNSKKRAERLVRVCRTRDGAWVEIGDAPITPVGSVADAEDDAALLRRILAREFRKVRRAALLRAAKEIRSSYRNCNAGPVHAVGMHTAAAIVEALAKPKRRTE